MYHVFLIRNDSDVPLFSFRQSPKLRPKSGDAITQPFTLVQFKILRDEFEGEPDDVTHNYFVTPANNPQRIASYSTASFANNQTLRQLFR